MITWTIEQLECLPQAEGKTDVVTLVHWRVTGVDGDSPASVYGTCNETYNSSEPFTDFSKLTQDQVCGWIWSSGVDKDEIEANINQNIATQKNPPIVKPPLPWVTA